MENNTIDSLYPETDDSMSQDSDTTYVMSFCDISSGNHMIGTTPYVLRKRKDENYRSVYNESVYNESVYNESVYKESKKLFLRKTGGIGTIVRKLRSSGNGYTFIHIRCKGMYIRLKSMTMVKTIHISDITSCKNNGSTLAIYTKDHGVVTLIMGSVEDAYAFSNVLG